MSESRIKWVSVASRHRRNADTSAGVTDLIIAGYVRRQS